MSDDLIPLSVPDLNGGAWGYVKDCLDTGWVSTAGQYVTRFEQMVAEQVGTTYGVACASGTAGLHLALIGAGLQPGEEVLVPALTFAATVNSVRHAGGNPVIIDVQTDTLQIDPGLVESFLASCTSDGDGLTNPRSGRRIAAIMPVHVLGSAAPMDPLLALAKRFDVPLVEDSTEALGGTYDGHGLGSLGIAGVISFNGNKLITTGGGGVLVTNDKTLADRARHLSTQAKSDPIEYDHDEVGFNYRMTNVTAAIGCAQMEVLADHLAARRAVAKRYHQELAEVRGLRFPTQVTGSQGNAWITAVLIDEDGFGHSSRQVLAALEQRNIQTRPLWRPMHLLQPFSTAQSIGGEVAEQLNRDGLCLPSSSQLASQPEQQDRVIDALVDLAA